MKEKTKWRQSFGKQRVARLLLTALLCTFLMEPFGSSIGNPLMQTALAASDEAIQAADELHELGLFQGSGTNADGSPNYNLDAPLNRAEAITMMIRIIGEEEKAKAGTWETPFHDVPAWAEPYVGYAYVHKYTNGKEATSFGSEDRITATEYITTILRALNYSSETDFQWNRAWELSDKIGLTDGRYTDENNENFLRADAVIVSAAALDIKLKDRELTLRDMLFSDTKVPFDYETRLLSDEQIKALKGKKPEELKKAISTLADARAYMDNWYKGFYANAMNSNNGWYQIPSAETVLTGDGDIAPNTLAACITYLLSDDFEVYTIYGLRQDFVKEEEQDIYGYPVKVINCVKTPEGYAFFTPFDLEHHGLAGQAFTLLPSANTASLEEYAAIVSADKNMSDVSALYMVTDGTEIVLAIKDGWFYIDEPVTPTFYASDNWQQLADKYKKEFEEKYRHVKPENIKNYKLSSMLGGVTLTVEEAYALVDAEPETIKEKVQTAGDMLMYMMAARFLPRSGDEQITIDGYRWHYNRKAEQVISDRAVNCGGAANLATYLLEGDYDEIGYIMYSNYPGFGGGHVYNYIKYDGYYYFIDYTQFTGPEYRNDPIIRKTRTLQEYASIALKDYKDDIHGDLNIILAFDKELPNVWTDEYYYIPAGTEYEVLYQAEDGYKLGELELDTSILDWREF